MKHTTSALRAAIFAARLQQRTLINEAAAVREMPPESWIRRISQLEARIFGLDAMEAAGKPTARR
jgi:hypothetical protein